MLVGAAANQIAGKSRDGPSTNQIAGFGGVVIQDGGPISCVTKSVMWFQIRQKKKTGSDHELFFIDNSNTKNRK